MQRETAPARAQSSGAGPLALWFAVLGGALAWATHLGVGYLLASLPCVADVPSTRSLLYALTGATAAVALAATAVGAIAWRRAGGSARSDLAEAGGAPGFLAMFGVMLSGISFLVIIVESFALPFLAFCE
jgi:hypothetical protein